MHLNWRVMLQKNEDFPIKDLTEMSKLVDIIDKPSAAISLFRIVSCADAQEIGADPEGFYFDRNDKAAEIYVELRL